jgi:catechol 2,3-dioxygenase-like lactoylglutathione lyase family enzyme
MRLATVSLLVRDYDEALAYFCGTMGFRQVCDTPQAGGRRWVVIAPPGEGGANLLLARAKNETEQASIGRQAGGRVWLFLETDRFDEDHARLKAAGVRFTEEPRHEAYGRVAVFEDLYGNRWDLIGPGP